MHHVNNVKIEELNHLVINSTTHHTKSHSITCVEDESHALFQCDLYAKQRSQLITNTNSAPQIAKSEQNQSQTILNIDQVTASNLESYLMAILSPNVTQSDSQIREIAQKIHNETLDSSQHDENTLTQLKFR